MSELVSEQKRLGRQLNEVKKAVAVLRGLGGQKSRHPRRKMSASARTRIAAAQRARWAKWKKQHGKKK